MKTVQHLATFALALTLSPVFGQWSDQNSGITNDLESVHFINDNEGWAVGRQGKIVHTTNAGATWTLQNSSTTNDLNKVFMVNSTCGYAVGDGGKFIKYNGTGWTTISISYSQDMFGVYFIDANTGWISGDWGRIMMTTDGGATWTTQVNNSMYTNAFRDLHMLSATDGWAVGTSGRVLHYNGTSWSNFTNPASGTLYSVSFSSPSNGFMTGQNSKVYHYDGTSWSEHSTSLPDNSFHVYGVHTINNSLAYAACTPGFGGAGYILKYNGVSWTTDYNFTGMGSELFTGVHFPSSTKGYVVGAGGQIKTKGTAGPSAIDEVEGSQLKMNAYPNPFTNNVYLTYEVVENGSVEILVSDLSGKVLNRVMIENQPAGEQVYQFDGSMLNEGIYLVQVKTGGNTGTLRVVK